MRMKLWKGRWPVPWLLALLVLGAAAAAGNHRGSDVSASLQGDGYSAEQEAGHVHVTSSTPPRSHGRKLLLEAVDLDAPKRAKGRKVEERGRSAPEGVRIYPGDDAAEERGPVNSKEGVSSEASKEGKREDKTAKEENKVRQGGDADRHEGAYYAQDVPLSNVPQDVAMKKPTLKAAADAASTSNAPSSSKQSGKACPDVSSCQMVCAGMEHRHSMCTTSRGRGSYQAACCEGSGRVCPSPPCAGGPPSKDSSSSTAMPPFPMSSMFGGNHPGMPMPLRPQLITPHSFLGGDSGGSGGHHQRQSHRHMHDDGGPSSSSQHPLAPLLGHIGKMLNGGSGGIMPHIVHMGPGGSIFGSSENDGDCSRITPISSKAIEDGTNMRDSVFLGGSNCYEITLPEGADHIRLGVIPGSGGGGFFGASRPSSPSSTLPVSVYSSPITWPEAADDLEVVLNERDAGVRWARVFAGEGPKLYLRVAAHGSKGMMPVSYQVMFAMPRHLRGPPVWYTPLEDIFVEHLYRAAWVIYAILGAFVGLALSTQQAAMKEKNTPVAYIMLFTFGIFAAHRFYLNRTASAIIWFSTLLLLTTGLAMDFAFLRGPWSTYPHHHALWAGILLVITLGMAYDLVMIPSMVSDKLYWERSRRARLRRKYARGKKFETIAEDDEGEEADIDDDEVELGKKKPQVGVVLEGAEARGPPLEASEADVSSPTRNRPSGSVVRRAGGTVGTGNTNTAGAGRYNIQWIADPAEPARVRAEGGDTVQPLLDVPIPPRDVQPVAAAAAAVSRNDAV